MNVIKLYQYFQTKKINLPIKNNNWLDFTSCKSLEQLYNFLLEQFIIVASTEAKKQSICNITQMTPYPHDTLYTHAQNTKN